MDQAQEQRIRERAYFIWKREGRPEGRHEMHWWVACDELEREDLICEGTRDANQRLSGDTAPDRVLGPG